MRRTTTMNDNTRIDHSLVPVETNLADRRGRANQVLQGPAVQMESDGLGDVAQKTESAADVIEWLGEAAPLLRQFAEWLRKASEWLRPAA
jgi:hypothetical protein